MYDQVIRIKDSIKPNTFDMLGDGTYYYNYDIREFIEDGDIKYDYVQILLWGVPNYSDCTRAIIREYISESAEFDLVNSYNKFQLGLTLDASAKTNYMEYLSLLDTIKTKVKSDFNE